MKLCLYIDPDHCRCWHKSLAHRLSSEHRAELSVAWSVPAPHPGHVERLLAFEKNYYHKGAVIGSEPMGRDALEKSVDRYGGSGGFDLVIDLVGDGRAPQAPRSVTLLYNGHPGEAALVSAIMETGLPQIALRDQSGHVVATAQPSAELAVGVIGSMDQAFARVITLMSAWIGHPERWVQPLVERKAGFPSKASLMVRTAKSLATGTLKQLYYRLFRASHWRIGWRWVDGDDVWSRHSLSGETWQVLKDRETHFYADPVPWQEDGRYYLFFEDLDQNTQKGELSCVAFDADGKPGEARVCLEEDYHLSYPFLIRHQGETYMIPETRGNRDVALYRATAFPFGWERQKILLDDIDAADVTITRHDEKWWLFCVTRDDAGGYSDCLSIFYAEDLFGPWLPHAQNPVLIDKATARPAGDFVVRDGKLMRPVQDCTRSYGAGLNLVEVTELTTQSYRQQVVTELAPNAYWPGRKLHMLNRAGASGSD